MTFKELNKALEDKKPDHIKILNEAARIDETTTKVFAYCFGIALAIVFFALLITT